MSVLTCSVLTFAGLSDRTDRNLLSRPGDLGWRGRVAPGPSVLVASLSRFAGLRPRGDNLVTVVTMFPVVPQQLSQSRCLPTVSRA